MQEMLMLPESRGSVCLFSQATECEMRLASILQPGERCKELDCTKDVQMATGERVWRNQPLGLALHDCFIDYVLFRTGYGQIEDKR